MVLSTFAFSFMAIVITIQAIVVVLKNICHGETRLISEGLSTSLADRHTDSGTFFTITVRNSLYDARAMSGNIMMALCASCSYGIVLFNPTDRDTCL
jgi:hypothetical protein